MPLPVVELLADRGTAERPALVRLLRALRVGCELRAPQPGIAAPPARFATSSSVRGLSAALRDPSVRVAVALDPGEVPAPELVERASVLVVSEPVSDAAPGERTVVVADLALDGSAHPPIAPIVRAGWRELLGLPRELVVTLGFPGTSPLGDPTIPTALALATAAAVTGSWIVPALALATPLVTDAATAARLGASDGEHVVVAHPSRASAVARELAGDATSAARLGRGARRLFDAAYDLRRSARAVLAVLAPRGPRPPLARLQERLDALETPVADPHALHGLIACASLAGPAGLTELTGTRR